MFKQCQACERQWGTRREYVKDCKLIAITDYTGLSLYNCPCGTTHGFDAIEMWPERQEEIINIWKGDKDFKLAAFLHTQRMIKKATETIKQQAKEAKIGESKRMGNEPSNLRRVQTDVHTVGHERREMEYHEPYVLKEMRE